MKTYERIWLLSFMVLQTCNLAESLTWSIPYSFVQQYRNIHYQRQRLLELGGVEGVVRESLSRLDIENQALKNRIINGIDKKVTEYTKLTPLMMGASDFGAHLVKVAEEIGEPSRLINWIHAITSEKQITSEMSMFLDSDLAREKNLSCPYHVPVSCRDTNVSSQLDGRCNNVEHPLWGAGFTPFIRLLPPVYESGYINGVLRKDLPRGRGKNGDPLPSPRVVSNTIHSVRRRKEEVTTVNMAYTHFGQFLVHDIADTAMEKGFDGVNMNCCNKDINTRQNRLFKPETKKKIRKILQKDKYSRRCAGIPVPTDDTFYSKGKTCLNFQRSKEVTDLHCQNGVREQLNMNSAFLDGTAIYGQTDYQLTELRETEGLLKSSIPNELPFMKHPNKLAFTRGINFLKAGDERVSEQLGVTGMVTVWHREHNRIAKTLSKFPIYANITDDTERSNAIFEEAKRIVVSELQHITYNEYLPLTVGPDIMTKYRCYLNNTGFSTGYDPAVDPSIVNVFATAAMRFGHPMVRQRYTLATTDYKESGRSLRLKKIFFRPNFYLLFEDKFQRGVLIDRSEMCTPSIDDDLRNHLLETTSGNGNDLASLNIQRGRDHGLPGYNDYRRAVGLSTASHFTSSNSGFQNSDKDIVERLEKIYSHPDDVDVWTGGLSEKPLPGAQVGPLFAEIIGEQFSRIRLGDRFWYENTDTGFSYDQLMEIKKVSLARIVCDNLPFIETVVRNAFQVPSKSNTIHKCSDIPKVDLEFWS